MKLLVQVNKTKLELTCRLGELRGDGDYTHPLIGEETLDQVLQVWVAERPLTRNFVIVGPDENRTCIVADYWPYGDGKGVCLWQFLADDTTWLFPLDAIANWLPNPQISWSIEQHAPAVPAPASEHVEAKTGLSVMAHDQAQRAANDALRDDPSFWIDEHSDEL